MRQSSDWFLYLLTTGLVMATTMGAGLFALPMVVQVAGWFTTLFYLVILGSLMIIVHAWYLRVLQTGQVRDRLLGLIRRELGPGLFGLALITIIAGLLFALLVYLILGSRFLSIIVPGLPFWYSLILVWLIVSLPFLLKTPPLLRLELWSATLMVGMTGFILLSSPHLGNIRLLPAVNLAHILTPFGPILFALAGWTAIEPIYDLQRDHRHRIPTSALALGTIVAAFFYIVFVLGITSQVATASPDTLSGLLGLWPAWKLEFLAILGLLLIFTSYLPVGLEVENGLIKDLGWPPGLGLAAVIFSPLLLVALGLTNFLAVIEFVGGVFLGLQYLFILLVSRAVLKLKGWQEVLAWGASLIFTLGAVYEFIVFFF